MGFWRTAISLAVSIVLGACTLGSLDGLSGGSASPSDLDGSADGPRDDASVVDASQETMGDGATSGQQIARLRLVNVDSTQPIAGFDPLADGVTLALSALPPRFTMEALTTPVRVGSVVFVVDSDTPHLENSAPYTVNNGVPGGQLAAWHPTLGSHVVHVTPYTASAGNGEPGETKTLAFVVTN
jgi:hypothetical protein